MERRDDAKAILEAYARRTVDRLDDLYQLDQTQYDKIFAAAQYDAGSFFRMLERDYRANQEAYEKIPANATAFSLNINGPYFDEHSMLARVLQTTLTDEQRQKREQFLIAEIKDWMSHGSYEDARTWLTYQLTLSRGQVARLNRVLSPDPKIAKPAARDLFSKLAQLEGTEIRTILTTEQLETIDRLVKHLSPR